LAVCALAVVGLAAERGSSHVGVRVVDRDGYGRPVAFPVPST
jgi:hypothetical protein